MIYQRYVRDAHLQDFLPQLGVILHKAFSMSGPIFFRDLQDHYRQYYYITVLPISEIRQ